MLGCPTLEYLVPLDFLMALQLTPLMAVSFCFWYMFSLHYFLFVTIYIYIYLLSFVFLQCELLDKRRGDSGGWTLKKQKKQTNMANVLGYAKLLIWIKREKKIRTILDCTICNPSPTQKSLPVIQSVASQSILFFPILFYFSLF